MINNRDELAELGRHLGATHPGGWTTAWASNSWKPARSGLRLA
ncbi:hypothetical protein [Actinomadura rudentiformis]|nr:hypothetical protein [Actinomadura rudentiformis]